jgi:hypothetical protein
MRSSGPQHVEVWSTFVLAGPNPESAYLTHVGCLLRSVLWQAEHHGHESQTLEDPLFVPRRRRDAIS